MYPQAMQTNSMPLEADRELGPDVIVPNLAPTPYDAVRNFAALATRRAKALASSRAGYMTGTVIPIDGGMMRYAHRRPLQTLRGDRLLHRRCIARDRGPAHIARFAGGVRASA